jgi:hypothetical protein
MRSGSGPARANRFRSARFQFQGLFAPEPARKPGILPFFPPFSLNQNWAVPPPYAARRSRDRYGIALLQFQEGAADVRGKAGPRAVPSEPKTVHPDGIRRTQLAGPP